MKKERKQLHVRIPDKVYKKLKIQCVHEDSSMQEYVAKLIVKNISEYSADGQRTEERAPRKLNRRRQ